MSGLRTDERSWMIYDEESIGAVIRAAEAFALSVTGQRLARHPDQRVRAVGNLMVRVGEHRGWEMVRNDGAQGEAQRLFSQMGCYLAGMPFNAADLTTALDQLHAAAFRIDQKAQSAGVHGPGTVRVGVRGD